MPDLLPVEQGRLGAIADTCDCCPYPCCNYCRIQVSWSVIASATRADGVGPARVVDTVTWTVGLALVFDVNPDQFADVDPPTFRVQEGELEDDDCQLLSNSGQFVSPVDTDYLYIRTIGGFEVDREEGDLTPVITDVALNLDCESNQRANTELSEVSAVVDAVDEFGVPGLGSMPLGWRNYLQGITIVFENILDGIGTRITTADELDDWDTSSLTDSASVAIIRCEDI